MQTLFEQREGWGDKARVWVAHHRVATGFLVACLLLGAVVVLGYQRFAYPNWAAKFFIDAMSLQKEIVAGKRT